MKSNIQSTVEQRGNKYGSIEENSIMTQALMDVITSNTFKGKLSDVHKECLHMIFHKISRMCIGDPYYADNAHDIAGYATLLEQYIESREDE
jgi:hypothetical protein